MDPKARKVRGYVPVGDEHSRRWAGSCTQRRCFNLIVAVVILANAVVISFEADLGLLGTGGRDWGSVKEDLDLVNMRAQGLPMMKKIFNQGMAYDQKYRNKAYNMAEKEMKKNGYSDKDMGMTAATSSLQAGVADATNDGAYTLIEYVFVTFYFFEWFIRLCDQGFIYSICCGWMWLDTFTLIAGMLDLSIPIAIKFNDTLPIHISIHFFYKVLSILRLMRVLRIVRLFRVLPELRELSRPFKTALGVIVKIAFLIFLVDFICAVVLTTMIGQKASQWGAHADKIDAWFGSIGRSIETLCFIMTLNGWAQYASVLSEVLPNYYVVPALVTYTMLCTLAVFGIVTGTICDSFALENREFEEDHAHGMNAHRLKFEAALRAKLETAGTTKEFHLTRKELQDLLYRERHIMEDLRVLDPYATDAKYLAVFDDLTRDNVAGDDMVRFDCLAEAIANQDGIAQGFSMVNVKYQCMATRVETADSTKSLKTDVAERHREGMDVTRSLHSDQAKLQACVRELQLACNGLSVEFKDLKQQMEDMEVREKEDQVTRQEASVGLNEDMSKMTVEVNAVLEAQRAEFATKIETVAERNKTAHDSVDSMKHTVDDLPRQIYNVTAQLQARVETIAKCTKILTDGPEEDEEEEEEEEYIEERWLKAGILFLKKQGKGQVLYKEAGAPAIMSLVTKEHKKFVLENCNLKWEDALTKEYARQVFGWEWDEKGVKFVKDKMKAEKDEEKIKKWKEMGEDMPKPEENKKITEDDKSFLLDEFAVEWETAIAEGYVKVHEPTPPPSEHPSRQGSNEPAGSAAGSDA